jgi:hypothetical protein
VPVIDVTDTKQAECEHSGIRYHRGRGAFYALCVEWRREKEEKKGKMPKKRTGLTRKPLWIITSCQNNRMDVLIMDPNDDGGFLPVFGFEEEAEAFLGLSEGGDEKEGWHSRQTAAGELVSLLMGPCASVKRVALDPLPLPLGRAMLPLASVDRERFVQDLMGGPAGDRQEEGLCPPPR